MAALIAAGLLGGLTAAYGLDGFLIGLIAWTGLPVLTAAAYGAYAVIKTACYHVPRERARKGSPPVRRRVRAGLLSRLAWRRADEEILAGRLDLGAWERAGQWRKEAAR